MPSSATGDVEPDRGREELGAELMRLRRRAGISGRELAQRIGVSQSTVSRIEAGRSIPAVPEVTAWAEAVGASPQTARRLLRLTESVYTYVHRWRAARQKRPHLQDQIAARESQARLMRTFQSSLVPGLLQTADYARRVFRQGEIPYNEQDAAAALQARTDRQQILFQEDHRFEFLITDGALRWWPGSSMVLAAQYDRIASLSTMDHVSIGLILIEPGRPMETSVPHGFVIYDGDDSGVDTYVTTELLHAELTVTEPDDVRLYEARWSLLRQSAIFGEDARRYLLEQRRFDA